MENHVARKLNIRSLDEWVPAQDRITELDDITQERLRLLGGLLTTLVQVYPNHLWPLWRFGARCPENWWLTLASRFNANDPNAIKLVAQYLNEDVAPKLGIKTLEDWKNVSISRNRSVWYKLRQLGGTVEEILQKVYPSHTWRNPRFPETNNEVNAWELLLSSQHAQGALSSCTDNIIKA